MALTAACWRRDEREKGGVADFEDGRKEKEEFANAGGRAMKAARSSSSFALALVALESRSIGIVHVSWLVFNVDDVGGFRYLYLTTSGGITPDSVCPARRKNSKQCLK